MSLKIVNFILFWSDIGLPETHSIW